jgi:hypothetical protein
MFYFFITLPLKNRPWERPFFYVEMNKLQTQEPSETTGKNQAKYAGNKRFTTLPAKSFDFDRRIVEINFSKNTTTGTEPRAQKTKENDTEGLTEISNGDEDLAETSNGGKRGKAEESGSKDLVENNKKLGAKEGKEEIEDLVKGNKGGEETKNSNKGRAETSKKLVAVRQEMKDKDKKNEQVTVDCRRKDSSSVISSKDLVESNKKLGTEKNHGREDDKASANPGCTELPAFPSQEEITEGTSNKDLGKSSPREEVKERTNAEELVKGGAISKGDLKIKTTDDQLSDMEVASVENGDKEDEDGFLKVDSRRRTRGATRMRERIMNEEEVV